MKKLMLFVFVILLVGTVSSFEFDNIKNYDEETRTIDIRNSILGIPFLQLGKVAEIQLNTPLIFQVPRGYQKVAEFTVTSHTDYSDAFKELELFDKRDSNRKFIRSYDYKSKIITQVPNYIDSCGDVLNENGTKGYGCDKIQNGFKNKITWKKLTLADFKKDDVVTIGIFTKVEKGDKVEWIPNLFGVRIDEWATWTENLNTDIISYYRLNGTSGVVLDALNNGTNGTNNGATRGVAGIINNSFDFERDDLDNVTIAGLDLAGIDLTINAWTLPESVTAATVFTILGTQVTGGYAFGHFATALYFGRHGETICVSSGAVNVGGGFEMVSVVYNSSGANFFINGTFVDTVACSFSFVTGNGYYIGQFATNDGAYDGRIDELGLWNRSLTPSELLDLFNNGTGITFTEQFPPNVTLNFPSNGTESANTTLVFNATLVAGGLSTLDNATHTIFFDNGTIFNQTTISISGTTNSTNLTVNQIPSGDFEWNVEACQTTGECSLAPNNFTFTLGTIIGNINFQATTFETATESYSLNITPFNSTTPTNGLLTWNGEETTATITDSGLDNFSFSATRQTSVVGSTIVDFNFTWDLGAISESASDNQTVNELLFQLCNSTISTEFINFSFRNETVNEELVNASISFSTWIFFLGDGSTNKTLTFSNATENSNYAFCSSAVNDTLFTTSTIAYTNSISQQRIFEPTLLTLTNITDARVLFLLPTVDGLFSTFRTEDTLGNTIIGAVGTITRILNGVTVGITSDSTDGSGLVIYFLDPDITYTAIFSASGFVDNTFSFVPTTDLRTVIMGSISAPPGGSNISLGLSFNITPTNATLNNGTDVTFQFNVSSFQTVTFMGMNISNGTATLLLVNQTSNGSIEGTINTGTNRSFIGVFTITAGNETIIVTRTWIIEQGFIGDYSIFNQFSLFIDYGFRDFIRLLIVIATLAIIMIFMSREIGIDEEVKMVVGILIVWAFSIVGWLDTGIALESTSSNINNLTQFSNQFGIAILSTVAASYFILRRVFRQI